MLPYNSIEFSGMILLIDFAEGIYLVTIQSSCATLVRWLTRSLILLYMQSDDL